MSTSKAAGNVWKLRNIVNVKDPAFGCKGDGVTDDKAATVLALDFAKAGPDKALFFPSGTYLWGSDPALGVAYSDIKWYGAGTGVSVIKKGFNGDLLTLTNYAGFESHSLEWQGDSANRTGKGIVFVGNGSNNPIFQDSVTNGFADTHIEFQADAGHSAQIIGHRAELTAGQADPRSLHFKGPDTGARIRRVLASSFEGYIDSDGSQDTYIQGCQFTRVEIDTASGPIFVIGCRWGNANTAMSISGQCQIVGNSFSGSVTLDAGFQGVFIGNVQSFGTFTDNTIGGNAIIHHHDLTAVYERVGRHKLRSVTAADMLLYSRTGSMGDANAVLQPGAIAPMERWANTLTADRTATLSDTAEDGDRFLITRSGGGAFQGLVKRANGFLLAVLLQNGWAEFEHDGGSWNCIASGQITGGNKALWSTTTTGNVGGGTDDLISLVLWGGAIGNIIGDAFGVSRGVRIKAWGSTANNANAKTITLAAGASTICTTAMTANQASTWEIEATILSTGDNTQKYVARMLQGGATTITDLENGTLALTDANTITIKCTGAGTADNDIVQEGMTIEFLN